MDADTGVEHLELIYMKGDKAHCGFPEISYGKYATGLIAKGFRVARIEQTETPDQLKTRNDRMTKGSKKDKVVSREMCSVLTRGTRTYSHLDDLTLLNEELGASVGGGNKYDMPVDSILICIQEKLLGGTGQTGQTVGDEENTVQPVVELGLCCVDTVLGE